MAIEKMMLVNILGKISALDATVEACCLDDDFHPERTMSFLEFTDGYTSITDENPYSPLLQTMDELAKGHTPGPDEDRDYRCLSMDLKDLQHYVQDLSARFGSLQEQHRQLSSQIAEDQLYQSQLAHFTNLDVRLNDVFSCEFTKVRFGRIPKDSYPKLQAYEDNPYLVFFPGSSDETHYWGVYFCPCDQADEIDRIFSHLYFERFRMPVIKGTPEEGMRDLQNQIDEEQRRLDELSAQIEKLWADEKHRFWRVHELLIHQSSLAEMRKYAALHGNLFHLIGWIPASSADHFAERFHDVEEVECVIDPPEKDDHVDPPIRLKNNWFSRPFEMFVGMFGLPKYHEIDPTKFISITYALLFGIMFGDVGQGILVALVGVFMWKKKKMMLGPILTRCGVSSCIFGAVYGSVFGFEELLDPLYESLFHLPPFKVMTSDHIIIILVSALGLGVVLNSISMVLNIFSSCRQRHFAEGLFGPSGVAGLIFYLSLLGGCVLQLLGVPVFSWVYLVFFIVLPIVVVFMRNPLGKLVSGEKNWWPKKFGEFFVENFFEVFEYLLSYATNTLSYLRVGAFVLVHAGMMIVVFTIANIFGPVGFTISVVIGNIFVAALEGLLVGIQCLRLEYYEMFSRFYEGGGRPFQSIRSLKPTE